MNSAAGIRRRRELKDHNARPLPKRRRKDPEASMQRSLLCLIICGVILTFFTLFYIDYIPWHLRHRAVDRVAKALGYHEPVHVVVIDAGSTGSRVLAFSFHKAYLDGHLVLDKELFEYIKPGLSSYADNPAAGAASIAKLIELAKKEIPKEYWRSTPLILKATAGLRLLPADKADAILNAVKNLFEKTPFLTDNDSVAIMDGTDEGILSWFTVNFLLDRFNYDPVKTVAALDLGGGSTQVTFYATTPATLSQKNFIHQAVTPLGVIPVYTHSYLGLGLKAARKEVITLNQENQTVLISDCVNPIIKKHKYHYAGVDYYVSGLQENYLTTVRPKNSYTPEERLPIVDFEKCSKIISDYVMSIAKPPVELPQKQIFAFSYYFDRAAGNGLIDATTGGKVTVQDFKKTALSVCSDANADQPFACLDITFIWILLEKGFGLLPDTTVYLYKKVNGHEISWALGTGYKLLEQNK